MGVVPPDPGLFGVSFYPYGVRSGTHSYARSGTLPGFTCTETQRDMEEFFGYSLRQKEGGGMTKLRPTLCPSCMQTVYGPEAMVMTGLRDVMNSLVNLDGTTLHATTCFDWTRKVQAEKLEEENKKKDAALSEAAQQKQIDEEWAFPSEIEMSGRAQLLDEVGKRTTCGKCKNLVWRVKDGPLFDTSWHDHDSSCHVSIRPEIHREYQPAGMPNKLTLVHVVPEGLLHRFRVNPTGRDYLPQLCGGCKNRVYRAPRRGNLYDVNPLRRHLCAHQLRRIAFKQRVKTISRQAFWAALTTFACYGLSRIKPLTEDVVAFVTRSLDWLLNR